MVVCALAVSKQHSVAAISPNENSRGLLVFKTYSKQKGIYSRQECAVRRDAVAWLHGCGTALEAYRFHKNVQTVTVTCISTPRFGRLLESIFRLKEP